MRMFALAILSAPRASQFYSVTVNAVPGAQRPELWLSQCCCFTLAERFAAAVSCYTAAIAVELTNVSGGSETPYSQQV